MTAKGRTRKTGLPPEPSADALLSPMVKIAEAITSDLYIEDILKLIVTVTAEVLNSPICSLMLLDEKKKELSVRATQSVSENYNRKPNIRLGEGIAGIACQTGKPVTSLDVREDDRYLNRDIAIKENLCSLLCVPLMVKGTSIGVLNVYTAAPHEFSQGEIAIIRTIANQAAILIENFRLVVETQVIREELDTRKAVERAKGILMKKEDLSEEEAYGIIRKFSMDQRKSMRDISEAIILSEDMKKFSKK
jgi:GAF domain-containing protein